MKKIKGLYCILPEFHNIEDYLNFVKKLLKYKPDVIQLRIKNKSDKFLYEVAFKIKKILSKTNIPFIIDDRLDIALLVKADGIHVGQDDLSSKELRKILNKLKLRNFIIGYSTHSLEQAKEALNLPINYISIGPVFETNLKPDYRPVGVEIVKEVKKLVNNKFPVVAIGGINHKNVELLKEAKPDAVAVISALKNLDLRIINKLKSIHG